MEPLMWLIVLAVFLVIEAITVGLTTIWFAGGALVAAIASGVVIQKINNLEQTGQVRINDIEWMARTSSDEVTIPEQTVVTIEAVQGVKLIVKEEKEGK